MYTLKEYPRKYLAKNFNPGNVESLEKEFEKLLAEKINSVNEMEKWLLKLSEFVAAYWEEGTRRFIDSTCNTEDEKIRKRFEEFIGVIEPKTKPYMFKIMKKIVENPWSAKLPEDKYATFMRQAKNEIELFREKNIPLQTADCKLNNEYQRVFGAVMVKFEGKEYTIPQMGRFLEENDPKKRESSWRATWDRFFQDRDKYNAIYNDLIKIRTEEAKNAGYDDYREFRFKELKRFDYGTRESIAFHNAVADVVVPLADKIYEKRRREMKLKVLYPWDLSVDPKGRPPLKPFKDGKELAAISRKAFEKVDPRLGGYFGLMIDKGLLDLDSRKGKAPGGYMSAFDERRLPFIFMNAAGIQWDVVTLLHEGGHAFHTISARDNELVFNRDYPIEFAEVASMSMEFLAGSFIDVFYKSADEVKRARKQHLSGVITLLPWIAAIDAFQHWIYTNPWHTREERNKAWCDVFDRFKGKIISYEGLDEIRQNRWMRQLHLFGYPFYYIEYGIAQLGALQVWMNYKKNPSKAVEDYLNGLSMGNTRKLPELFKAANIKFDFSKKMIQNLMDMVQDELKKIGD